MEQIVLDSQSFQSKQSFITYIDTIFQLPSHTNLDALYDDLCEVTNDVMFLIDDAILYEIAKSEEARKYFELILNVIHENPHITIAQK